MSFYFGQKMMKPISYLQTILRMRASQRGELMNRNRNC